MLFNSWTFLVFFSVVIVLYYLLSHRWQNRMLLVASYFFYGWWDWRFLSLIFISTVTDYICGIQIYEHQRPEVKKRFLIISVVVNLSLLGFFKYWGFFVQNFVTLLSTAGINANIATLHIILPVGISFYTFQTMTYSIDIYRGEIEPTHNFFDFALFVSFFPQLVAGPIERAKNLLPQIQNDRNFDKDQMLRGLQLIFWGLFKKVFVADNLAIIVDQVYSNPAATGAEYIIATWAFAFQIYGDFSGYSDIARGTAKCLGIELMVNFRQPYFAVNPSELWRHWHISLSTWLRDYLYIPLGGNRKGTIKTYRNLLLTMLLGGLWHGAAWNFVIWGAFHGFLLTAHRFFTTFKRSTSPFGSHLLLHMIKAFFMFHLTCLGWIFFRAQTFDHIKLIFHQIFSAFSYTPDSEEMLIKVLFFSAIPIFVMAVETFKSLRPVLFSNNVFLKYCQFSNLPFQLKNVAYAVLTYLLCFYGAKAQAFIYFQF